MRNDRDNVVTQVAHTLESNDIKMSFIYTCPAYHRKHSLSMSSWQERRRFCKTITSEVLWLHIMGQTDRLPWCQVTRQSLQAPLLLLSPLGSHGEHRFPPKPHSLLEGKFHPGWKITVLFSGLLSVSVMWWSQLCLCHPSYFATP